MIKNLFRFYTHRSWGFYRLQNFLNSFSEGMLASQLPLKDTISPMKLSDVLPLGTGLSEAHHQQISILSLSRYLGQTTCVCTKWELYLQIILHIMIRGNMFWLTWLIGHLYLYPEKLTLCPINRGHIKLN